MISIHSEGEFAVKEFEPVRRRLGQSVSINEFDDASIIVSFAAHDSRWEQWKHLPAKKVLLPHAFEIDGHIASGTDLSFFDVLCVGDIKTYELAKRVHPNVIYTGIPIFDELVKKKREDKGFYLATSLITSNEWGDYFDEEAKFLYKYLPDLLNKPVKFKWHPNQEKRTQKYMDLAKDTVDCHMYDILPNATALIASFSFSVVEASIIGVPIISYPRVDTQKVIDVRCIDSFAGGKRKNNTFWSDYDYNNLGCGLDDLRYTKEQHKIRNMFLHDGGNTERVVNVLENL